MGPGAGLDVAAKKRIPNSVGVEPRSFSLWPSHNTDGASPARVI